MFRVLIVGATLAVLHAAPIAAQSDEAAASEEYRRQIDSALREYKLGNFNEAKAYFAQAHAMSPSARTYRGLGTCSYELRDYVDAIQWFEKSLSSTDRPLTPEMRTEIQGLLRQARTFIVRLRVSVEPSWAKLLIDARPVERDHNGFIRINPGTHELTVEAPHYETVMRTVRSNGGEELELEVALGSRREAEVRSPSALPSPPPTSPTSPARIDEPTSPARASSVGPWVVIAASASVAIAGGVFLALAMSDKAAVEHPSGAMPRYDRSADDRVLPLSAVGITGLAVGGVGIIAGILWKVGDGTEEDEPRVALDLGPAQVRVRGVF